MEKLYHIYSGDSLKVAEKIQQRRLQMLVHSYIYYAMNDNIVTDDVWSKWAVELKELQERYSDIEKRVPYRKGFENWDASTGAYLPYKDDHIIDIAYRLLHKKREPVQVKKEPVKKVRKKLF